MVWRGVIIEESLDDRNLLKMVKIVETKSSFLEEEEEKGQLSFHSVEVEDKNKNNFVKKAKSAIKQGWYTHICRGSRMAVIFKGRHFEFDGKEKKKLKQARNYGLSIGIIEEQLPSESLIRNPYD